MIRARLRFELVHDIACVTNNFDNFDTELLVTDNAEK